MTVYVVIVNPFEIRKPMCVVGVYSTMKSAQRCREWWEDEHPLDVVQIEKSDLRE